ncbi:hypothetical protein EON65_57435, partial [archaeon]
MDLDSLELEVSTVLDGEGGEIEFHSLARTVQSLTYYIRSRTESQDVNVLLLLMHQILSKGLQQEGLESILASVWELYLPLLRDHGSNVSPDIASLFLPLLAQVTRDGLDVLIAAADVGSTEHVQELETNIPLLWTFQLQ